MYIEDTKARPGEKRTERKGGPVTNLLATKLILLVDEFRKVNKEMQANQMALFLHIAAQPDLTIKEYAMRAGLGDGGTVSRNVDALTETRRVNVKGKIDILPGHNLIALYEDAMDRRFKRVKLTPRGVMVYNSLVQLLDS